MTDETRSLPSQLESELVVTNQTIYLGLLRAHTHWFCSTLCLAEAEAGRLTLALVETVTNVMRHAYGSDTGAFQDSGSQDSGSRDSGSRDSGSQDSGPRGGEIRVRFHSTICEEGTRSITFEILDRGQHVDRSALKGREPDEGEPGGLGLKMMDCCMDSVEYNPRDGGGSHWVLKKSCAGK